MTADDNEIVGLSFDLADRDLDGAPFVNDHGFHPSAHRALLHHLAQADAIRARDTDAWQRRHLIAEHRWCRITPGRLDRAVWQRRIGRVAPVEAEIAHRAVQRREPLLFMAARPRGGVGDDDLSFDVAALIVGQAAAADIDQFGDHALRPGRLAVAERHRRHQHRLRSQNIERGAFREAHQAGHFVNLRAHAGLVHRGGAVFGHPAAVRRPRHAGRVLACDVLDVFACSLAGQLAQDRFFTHDSPVEMRSGGPKVRPPLKIMASIQLSATKSIGRMRCGLSTSIFSRSASLKPLPRSRGANLVNR